MHKLFQNLKIDLPVNLSVCYIRTRGEMEKVAKKFPWNKKNRPIIRSVSFALSLDGQWHSCDYWFLLQRGNQKGTAHRLLARSCQLDIELEIWAVSHRLSLLFPRTWRCTHCISSRVTGKYMFHGTNPYIQRMPKGNAIRHRDPLINFLVSYYRDGQAWQLCSERILRVVCRKRLVI